MFDCFIRVYCVHLSYSYAPNVISINRVVNLFNVITVEVTCQHKNGGCNQVCNDAEIGVNCSCHGGYQLVDTQNCTGTKTVNSNLCD